MYELTGIKCAIQKASSIKGQFPRPAPPRGIHTNSSIQHLTQAHHLQHLSRTTNLVLSCFTAIFCPYAFTRTDVSLQPIKWSHKFWHQLQQPWNFFEIHFQDEPYTVSFSTSPKTTLELLTGSIMCLETNLITWCLRLHQFTDERKIPYNII